MAQWVSANFSEIVPDEVNTILSSADTLLSTVSDLLSAVSAPLLVAKNFLVGLPTVDLAEMLRELIDTFKSDILGMGFYICPMWDYVLHQVSDDFGPGSTYGSKVLQGGSFQNTFLSDLVRSFDDLKDANRPTFKGSVSMLVLVAAAPHVDDIGIGSGDQGIERYFSAISTSAGNAAKELAKLRWQTAWAKMRAAAELTGSNTAARVERVQKGYNDFCRMNEDYISRIPEPTDPATGNKFFENLESISWENDIKPLLESVEECVTGATYPNWRRSALVEVYPEIVECIDTIFDPILAAIPPSSSIVGTIVEMIKSIEAKIKILEDLIAAIDKFLEDIENLKSLSGIYAIMVSSDSGVTGLKTALQGATGYPTGDNFYAGTAILVGGPSVTAFQTLFGALAS